MIWWGCAGASKGDAQAKLSSTDAPSSEADAEGKDDADLSAEDAMSDLLMCLGLEEQKTQL